MFDEFQSLIYKRQRNGAGWYRLILGLPDDRTVLFERDGQVEIYRRGDWTEATWIVDFAGFHQRAFYRMDANSGQEWLESWGPGYLSLLAGRIGMKWYHDPASDRVTNGYLWWTGPPDEVIGVLAWFEAGPGAYWDASIDRRQPGFTIAPVAGIGTDITEYLRNDNLLAKLQGLAEAYNLDIRIVGNGPAQFEMRIAQVGIDRRLGNAAGNPPVIFSTEYGNMIAPSYIEDHLDEVNAVYVGGRGEAASRAILADYDGARIATSPWGRHEKFVDARDTDEPTAMQARANKALERGQPIIDLSFDVNETEACRYGRDWDLGDLVTGRYRDIQRDYRIETVRLNIDSQGIETTGVELAEYGG